MCRATTCRTCQKTTWAGCGQHVAQVRATVPPDRWCPGHPDQRAAASRRPRWLDRLLGR